MRCGICCNEFPDFLENSDIFSYLCGNIASGTAFEKGAAKGLNNLTDRHLSADVPNIITAEPKGSMTQIILPYDFVIVHIMSFYVILINLNI